MRRSCGKAVPMGKTVKDASPSGVRIPDFPQKLGIHNSNMYITYNLKSIKDGTHSLHDALPISKRLKYHNAGKSRYTKKKKPWVLHYTEEYETKTEAIQRELFFKTINGYIWLKEKQII